VSNLLPMQWVLVLKTERLKRVNLMS